MEEWYIHGNSCGKLHSLSSTVCIQCGERKFDLY